MKKTILLLLLLCLYNFGKAFIYGYANYYEPDPSIEQIDAVDYLGLGCFPPSKDGGVDNLFGKEKLHRIIEKAKSVGTPTILSFAGGNIVLPAELVTIDSNRQRLVSECMDLVEEFDFDGIDNDWEPDYFTTGDSIKLRNNRAMLTHYNTFMKELRDSLDARFGEGEKMLTAAVVGDPVHPYWDELYGHSEVCFPDSFWVYCDYVFLMSFGQNPGKDYGSIDDCFAIVANWQNFGVPDEKLVPSIGFWGAAKSETNWADIVSYHLIIDKLGSNDSSATSITADFGAGPLTYGFSNIENVKTRLSKSEELGFPGIGINAIGGDVPIDHPMSLIRALTGYVPKEKKVTLKSEIENLVKAPAFVDTIVLTDHFSIESGELTYSIASPLETHSAVVTGDKLIITGSTLRESGVEKMTIRAANSENRLDYIEQSFVVVVDVRTPVEPTLSENLVTSEGWVLDVSHEQFTLPENAEALRSVNSSGDTIISLIGTVLSQANWNWTSLGVKLPEIIDMTKKEVVLEYKSSIDLSKENITVSFVDTSGAYHIAVLESNKGTWIKDTLTSDDLKKGHGQPDSIDYSQIESISFSLGGSGEGFLYDFQLREYKIEPRSTSIAHSAVKTAKLFNIDSQVNGVLKLNHNFKTDHQLKITDLRGREIFSTAIQAGVNSSSITLPLARGVYIAQISGVEVKTAWKVGIE